MWSSCRRSEPWWCSCHRQRTCRSRSQLPGSRTASRWTGLGRRRPGPAGRQQPPDSSLQTSRVLLAMGRRLESCTGSKWGLLMPWILLGRSVLVGHLSKNHAHLKTPNVALRQHPATSSTADNSKPRARCSCARKKSAPEGSLSTLVLWFSRRARDQNAWRTPTEKLTMDLEPLSSPTVALAFSLRMAV